MRTPYIGHPYTRISELTRADAIPTVQVADHVERLIELGMTMNMVARAAGVTNQLIANIRSGRSRTTLAAHARAILAVDGRPSKHQAMVLAFATRRRLEGLAVLGWSQRDIGHLLGVSGTWAYQLTRLDRVSWENHERVRILFDSLGSDGGSERTRSHALKQGYVHPMLWDEIDDPSAVPSVGVDSGEPDPVVVDRLVNGKSVPASRSERWAAFELLRRRGLPDLAIAERIGVEPRTVQRYSQRARQVAV